MFEQALRAALRDFIGGIAVQHWGEPRMTRDLDWALLAGYGTEEPFVKGLLEIYELAELTKGGSKHDGGAEKTSLASKCDLKANEIALGELAAKVSDQL